MTNICSHSWIDPLDPPIQRTPYSPIIGPGRRQMKPGVTYRCRNCGQILFVLPGAKGDPPDQECDE